MILGYNINFLSISNMILIGVTCTYLTIIATLAGIVEIIVKLMEVIFQRIAKKDNLDEQEMDEKEMKAKLKNRLMCHIGRSLE